ncbi:peptidase [Streptomyces sp. SR27]|uniref:SH3 domain-containing protein n=1 Tax=unclassified Streptomyces TaxID=2593676 RepID=UPI00295BF7D4|nr:peptidase [Streptomyces sp. SR27]MDV9191441.1 peptidase [Streptomyces sp. SR27]
MDTDKNKTTDDAATPSAVTAMAASRYTVAPGYQVNVRSGPGTQYAIVRALPVGATVAISCQKYGEWITGPYGTTRIWDSIAPGEYVSDAYVHTGSDGFVAPRCA